MNLSGEHRLRVTLERAWELLLDPAVLRAAIPGCERFEPAGPGTYDVTLRVGVAMLRGTYSARVEVVDQVPPESYRLTFAGTGKSGGLRGDGALKLIAQGEGTLVRYRGEAHGGGVVRASGFVAAGAARLLIGQFFRNLDHIAAGRG